MGRDKHKDDLMFNCSQDHEIDYVANLYADAPTVRKFLKQECAANRIHHSKHMAVYELIKQKLGYPIPV